jgi:proteasome accessory factor A
MRELLPGRQRMQISLGDSNLCEEAEYLRVATTALVLDAIEAGAIPSPPRLRRPLAAIRQISRDPTLTTAVALVGGRRLTALALQRWYLGACRRFVDSTATAPEEARALLDRWQDVLDRLEGDRLSLVGRLDWVTKQYLLDQAGHDLPWAARKKIDLRYHELSPAGYFSQLRAAGRTATLVTDAEVDQATRLPPSSSPALERSRYIREFSGQSTVLKVGWRFLNVVSADGKRTVIDLHEPTG